MGANITRHAVDDIERRLANHLGESYRIYRDEWGAAGPDSIPAFPVHLDVELNDCCNQKCAMCPRNAQTHPHARYRLNTGVRITVEEFNNLMDEGAAKGLRSVNLGAFAEPLIHPGVFEMISYAHRAGLVDTRLITNGLALDRSIGSIFESGLINLFVSLDAFREETYESIRGKGFSRVRENLLALLDEKKRRASILPIVRVSFIDMHYNRGEKDAFIEFWRDKVDFIDIQVYDNFDDDPSLPLDLSRPKKWSCCDPWRRMAVLANGNVLPCCNFFGYNIPIGNWREQTLGGVWHSPALAKLRQDLLSDANDNCSRCQRSGS